MELLRIGPMVSILTTYRKSYVGFSKKPIIGPLKSKMAEIRHLENRHDVIIARGSDIAILSVRPSVCLSVCT